MARSGRKNLKSGSNREARIVDDDGDINNIEAALTQMEMKAMDEEKKNSKLPSVSQFE